MAFKIIPADIEIKTKSAVFLNMIELKRADLERSGRLLLEIDNKVFNREFDNPSRDDEEEINYLKGSEVYIAYENRAPIGFFAYKVEGNDAEVKTMAVLPEWQGKGVGREMMRKLFDLTLGKHLKLVTHPKNSQALIFYLKSGFRVCGWTDNYFGDGEPRLSLERGNP